MVSFVKSSIELGHKDKEIAKYLKRVQLTEKLPAGIIENLQGDGAGPRTLDALWELSEASNRLPEPRPVTESKHPMRPPPSPEDQARIIEEVREYALNFGRGLPDYICTQVTRRYVDPKGLEIWYKVDTITAKVTYFEQKEDYKVILVNNRPVNLGMMEVGGSTSQGEFGSMMNEIFDPATDTAFQWEKWGKLRDRLCHVYNYFVRQEKSEWSISYEKTHRTIPAYRGLIYIDRDTQMVTRITLHAVNIEPSFPVQEAQTVLDFDLVKISEGEYMLPLKSKMRMRQGIALVKNETEFRLYRKYSADAVISFDVPEELPGTMFTEEPVEAVPEPQP
jgi:hypothetical protein